MKKIAIMQPTCFPWLGYFSLINAVDEFVFLDDVQFQKRSWQQRNRIKLLEKEKWLTIPVFSKGKFEQSVNSVLIMNVEKTKKQILQTIFHGYRKSVYFDKFFPLLEKTFLIKTNNLAEFNITFIKFICELLEIKTQVFRSSDIPSFGHKDLRLISLCLERSASHYISPPGSKDYIDEGDNFEAKDIKVSYFEYQHPKYTQLGENFVEFLSIIDCLMNQEINMVKSFLNMYRLVL